MEGAFTVKNGNGKHRSGSHMFAEASVMIDRGKEFAGAVYESSREHVKRDLEIRKNQAAGRLKTIGGAIGSAAGHLRENGENDLATYTESAGRYVANLSETVRNRSVNDLLEDAADFAKKNTAFCICAAVVFGALVTRFMQRNAGRR